MTLSLYIDADGCNTKTRTMLQHYVHRNITVILVSNTIIKPENTLVKTHITSMEKNSTDTYITIHAKENDLVITRDLTLAKILLKKKVRVISDYGEIYQEETIEGRIIRSENNKEIRTFTLPLRKKNIAKKQKKRINTLTAFIDKWISENS